MTINLLLLFNNSMSIKKYLSFPYVIMALLAMVLFNPWEVKADIIMGITDTSTAGYQISTSGGVGTEKRIAFLMGNNISGTLTNVAFTYNINSGSSQHNAFMGLIGCSSLSAYNGWIANGVDAGCSNLSGLGSINGGNYISSSAGLHTMSASTTPTAFSTSTYYIALLRIQSPFNPGVNVSFVGATTTYMGGCYDFNSTDPTTWPDCGSVGTPAVNFTGIGSLNVQPSTATRIISVTPNNGVVIPASTSTAETYVTFNITYYVSPADIGGLTSPYIHVTMENIDQNVLLSTFSPNTLTVFDINATSSGHFSATTTVGLPKGNYRTTSIMESYLASFYIPFTQQYDKKYSQFIVGEGTFMGNASQNGFNALQALLGATTSTSTIDITADCGPLSGTFDFGKCLGDLFIPHGDYINNTIASFKDGVSKKFPWGYFTRIYEILSSTDAGGLPTFSPQITMGTNGHTSTTTLTFDMDDMLIGGANLVESIHDPYNNKTARDIFEPIIQLSINIGIILTIIVDLTGSHRHHVNQANADTGENKKRKLS